jgi:predicted Zn-dependent protease
MTAHGAVHGTAHGAPPRRLEDAERFLTREQCEQIARRVFALARGEGTTRVMITSWWAGELRWAGNRPSLASDRRDIAIQVGRRPAGPGSWQWADTNQLDDSSLESVVRAAERFMDRPEARSGDIPSPFETQVPDIPRPQTAIWSDRSFELSTESRAEVARAVIRPAQAKGVLSAGYLEVMGASRMQVASERPDGPYAPWDEPYVQWTLAQCSMTVRDQQGAGSGWAGLSSSDWSTIDAEALGARALEKCLASRNPVALEPGRYTVILEPQAVADLVEVLEQTLEFRTVPEMGFPNPWLLGPDQVLEVMRTKLGLKVVDERITISHDPVDPELGILPAVGMQPVTWIDHGVLTNLGYLRSYALTNLNRDLPLRGPTGYRMTGGQTSVDEMIQSTKRGLLVTRFSDVSNLDPASLVSTGVTRDGLWLIENGKVTKAVKNLRFTESPLFVLNSLEQLGPPQRVFRTSRMGGAKLLTPAIVPPLKARDFSFTSTSDAI